MLALCNPTKVGAKQFHMASNFARKIISRGEPYSTIIQIYQFHLNSINLFKFAKLCSMLFQEQTTSSVYRLNKHSKDCVHNKKEKS